MEEILKLKSENLRNEEFFEKSTEVVDMLEVSDAPHDDDDEEYYDAETLGVGDLFVLYKVKHSELDSGLEVIRKSSLTADLAASDAVRDKTFRGINDIVKGYLKHFDEEMSKAARRVKIVIEHYGNLSKEGYTQETASFRNLLQDFKGDYAADISLLGLNDWVAKLEADNLAFAALMNERYTEAVRKSEIRVREVRKEVTAIYRKMIKRIEALRLINGDAKYAAFVRDLNVRTAYYNDIVNKRKGRNAKKRKQLD
jgi:hypothetical protein